MLVNVLPAQPLARLASPRPLRSENVAPLLSLTTSYVVQEIHDSETPADIYGQTCQQQLDHRTSRFHARAAIKVFFGFSYHQVFTHRASNVFSWTSYSYTLFAAVGFLAANSKLT